MSAILLMQLNINLTSKLFTFACSTATHSDNSQVMKTYGNGMSAQMFLSCESFAADLTRIWPFSCVAADVPLQNALLFGCVWAEWTFVQPPYINTHIYYKTIQK